MEQTARRQEQLPGAFNGATTNSQHGRVRWYLVHTPHGKERETCEKVRRIIPHELMKDAFVSKLSAGNYAEAFKAYAEKADFLISYYEKEGKAYDPDDQFSFLGLGIAAVLSLLGAFGVRNYLIGTMSNVAPGVNASHYLDKDSFAVTGENDYYLYTNRIVTPLPEKKDDGVVGAGGSMGGGSGGNGGGGGKF